LEVGITEHNFGRETSKDHSPRWPPLLNIEISSNGQNGSILSQKVPKFELNKHNDELFNIYYRIFYVRLVEIGSVVSEEKIFF
jgi:hypothetical protein